MIPKHLLPPEINFNKSIPNILVVDDFYQNPEEIIKDAFAVEFKADERFYKGMRTEYRFLYPYIKEEFERLLGARITDWMDQPMNGIFQITNKNNPIVWHSDNQDYAAAIYLTPGHDAEKMGTSFWRDKTHGCRRPPDDEKICNEIFKEYNLLHPDNWELVDKIAAVFNRLVIWDAKMIHSASEYSEKDRLVQLFFFSIEK